MVNNIYLYKNSKRCYNITIEIRSQGGNMKKVLSCSLIISTCVVAVEAIVLLTVLIKHTEEYF